MKVTLRKVTKTPLKFEIHSKKITFKGSLEYYSSKFILLKANLSGLLEKPCDMCGEEFQMSVDEVVEFYISDGIYEDRDEIELDVVESLDGNVDIEELLHSEIELIKSDYHSCEKCREE